MTDVQVPDGLYEAVRQVARAQSYVTYGILMPLLGLRHPITPDRHKLEGWLGHISECEHQQGRPLLSVLVVNRDTRLPSAGFFTLARQLGRFTGPNTPEAKKTFAEEETRRVYAAWP
jgi:hypothetical protein